MAGYKHDAFLKKFDHPAYDQLWNPGLTAPYSGIYRCQACGREAVSIAGQTLPPADHHRHAKPVPIQWRLIVASLQA